MKPSIRGASSSGEFTTILNALDCCTYSLQGNQAWWSGCISEYIYGSRSRLARPELSSEGRSEHSWRGILSRPESRLEEKSGLFQKICWNTKSPSRAESQNWKLRRHRILPGKGNLKERRRRMVRMLREDIWCIAARVWGRQNNRGSEKPNVRLMTTLAF